MVKLPTKEDLGGLPSAGGRGPVSKANPQAPNYELGVYRGDTSASVNAKNLAAGLQDIGRGISAVGGSLDRVLERDERLAEYQAKAAYERDMIGAQLALRTDTDFATHGEKFAEAEKEARARAIASLPSNDSRAYFNAYADEQSARAGADVRLRQHAVETEQVDASLSQGYETDYRLAIDPQTDSFTRKKTLERIDEGINAGLAAGRYTAPEAAALKDKYITSAYYDIGSEKLINDGPVAAYNFVTGDEPLRTSIIDSESKNNPVIENRLGFTGLYQFGAPRLEHLGVYTPGPKEVPILKRWGRINEDSSAGRKWSGTFNIPGHPEVKTLADLKINREAQETLWDLHHAKAKDEIKARGLDKYIGTVTNGVPITHEALVGMIHLGGADGTAGFLSGSINPQDLFGTSIKTYGLKHGGASILSAMAPNQRRQLLGQIQSASENLMKVGTYQEASVALGDTQKKWLGGDAEDAKRISAVYEHEGLSDKILQGDEDSYARAGSLVAQTNFIPNPLRATFDTAVRSGDVKTTTKMLDFFVDLSQSNYAAVTTDMSEEQLRKINTWQLRKKFQDPEEFVAQLTEPKTPEKAEVDVSYRKEAARQISSGELDVATEIIDGFGAGGLWGFGASEISEAQSAEALVQWGGIYHDELARARGNEDLAKKNTHSIFARRYSVSELTGSDTTRITTDSPERMYGLKTPEEIKFARKQLEKDIGSVVPDGVEWELMPAGIDETTGDFAYDILADEDGDGTFLPLFTLDRKNPLRWHLSLSNPYETETAKAERRKKEELVKSITELNRTPEVAGEALVSQRLGM